MHRPEDFRGENPPRRIFGLENEYSVHPGRSMTSEALRQRLNEQGIKSVGSHCVNGARVYIDVGSHVEYATPECDSPEGATEADFGGMEVIRDAFKPPAAATPPKLFPIIRNAGSYNIDADQTFSRGYHQNLLIPYPEDSKRHEQFKALFGSFLATRIIWDGAGLATRQGYLLGQKAPGIGQPVVDGFGNDRTTHGYKPLAGLLAGGNNLQANDKVGAGWGILEVRSADAHMSKTQTYTSLAMTSLALRLFEQGLIDDKNIGDFIITDPVESLHHINANMGRGKLRLGSGKYTTARSLQIRFAELALTLPEHAAIPDGELPGAQHVLDACQKLGHAAYMSSLQELDMKTEWATKRYRMELHTNRKTYTGTDASRKKLQDEVAFDLQWHSTEEKSLGLRIYDRHDPRHQKPNDPFARQGTRADARGKAIASRYCSEAGWNFVKFTDGTRVRLSNSDFWNPELLEEIPE